MFLQCNSDRCCASVSFLFLGECCMLLMHMTVCASVPTVCAHVVCDVYMLCICCVYVVYMLCLCIMYVYLPVCLHV